METKCNKCGKCCKQIRYFLADEDEKRWWELHGLETEEDGEFYWGIIPQPCTKLIDNKCSIHESRPDVCRNYFCNKED